MKNSKRNSLKKTRTVITQYIQARRKAKMTMLSMVIMWLLKRSRSQEMIRAVAMTRKARKAKRARNQSDQTLMSGQITMNFSLAKNVRRRRKRIRKKTKSTRKIKKTRKAKRVARRSLMKKTTNRKCLSLSLKRSRKIKEMGPRSYHLTKPSRLEGRKTLLNLHILVRKQFCAPNSIQL